LAEDGILMTQRSDYWEKLNSEQAGKDPRYKALLETLQGIHPTSVLLLPSADYSDLDLLLKRGKLFRAKKIRIFPGSRWGCHKNAACLWIMEQASIATGFAYQISGNSGGWFPHSWGIDGTTIIETTQKCNSYWGLELNHAESQTFALDQIVPMFEIDKLQYEKDRRAMKKIL